MKSTDASLIPWGDTPDTLKDDKCCRIIMQNVNGVRARLTTKSATMAANSKKLRADIIGLIETNADWKRGNVLINTKNEWQKCFDQTILVKTSSSDIQFNTDYQPGGTMTIVGSQWASSTLVTSDESGLGRWTVAEINGENNRTVTLITVYAVGKSKLGTQTTCFQQFVMLNAIDRDQIIDPRDNLFKDLKLLVEEKRKEGKEVIIMIDANDTLQKPNSQFSKWVKETELIDIHTERHGTDKEPPTHDRGSTRIDYILVSKDISRYVTAAGILPMHEFTRCDHRALYIDVNMKKYLGGNAQIHYNPKTAERVRMIGGDYKGKMGTFKRRTPQKMVVIVDGDLKQKERYLNISCVEFVI